MKTRYDRVLLSCKTADFDSAIADFTSAVGPNTVVLDFLNGLGVYGQLDAHVDRERVAAGGILDTGESYIEERCPD
ncbi:hypothetical protein IQ285_12900 [Burkholderia sp. R-69608]|uniref:2-dehydropantoate 2-reductase N-terminal domain-containing protein n=1 Tax=Paraburkholderia nemoris TaxID=2793076 RepID=UPI0019142980|nr:hypothetical protein [Burkholderia sp. R-69608]